MFITMMMMINAENAISGGMIMITISARKAKITKVNISIMMVSSKSQSS